MRKSKLRLLGICLVILLPAVGLLGYYLLVTAPAHDAQAALEKSLAAMRAHQLESARRQLTEAASMRQTALKAGLALFELTYLAYPEEAETLLSGLRKAYGPLPEIIAGESLLSGDFGPVADRLELASDRAVDPFLANYAYVRKLLAQTDAPAVGEVLLRLRGMYPERPLMRLLYAQVLAGSGKPLESVVAKSDLLALVQPPSSVSLQASLVLLSAPSIPLFAADLRAIADSLNRHPWVENWLKQLSPAELRLMVNRIAADAPEVALRFSTRLTELAELSASDRITHLDLLLKLGKAKAADAYAETFKHRDTLTEEEQLALVRHAFIARRTASGMELLRNLLQVSPASNSAVRVIAFLLAETSLAIPLQERIELMRALAAHPASATEVKLATYADLIREDPANRELYIERAVAVLPADRTVAQANWLSAVGESAAALERLDKFAALAEPAALSARFNALLALERFTEAEELLQSPLVRLNPLQSHILNTRLHHSRGAADTAAVYLNMALAEADAANDPQLFVALGDVAAEVGDDSALRKAYHAGFSGGANFDVAASIRFLQALLQTNQLDLAAEFTAYCRKLAPDNPIFINNDCYLSVLRRESVTNCVIAMRAVVEQFPAFNAFRGTFTLALLRNNEPKTAARIWAEKVAEPDADPTHMNMISALVFAANEQRTFAESTLRFLDRRRLNAAEIALMGDFSLFPKDLEK